MKKSSRLERQERMWKTGQRWVPSSAIVVGLGVLLVASLSRESTTGSFRSSPSAPLKTSNDQTLIDFEEFGCRHRAVHFVTVGSFRAVGWGLDKIDERLNQAGYSYQLSQNLV